MLRSARSYDRSMASRSYDTVTTGDMMTVQSDAKNSDINELVRRFSLTGEIPQNVRRPLQGDFDVLTFQDAQNAIVKARNSFAAMSAKVREQFQNDPARFVDFCSNPENLDEMRKMGLAVPKKEVKIDEPMRVRVVVDETVKDDKTGK